LGKSNHAIAPENGKELMKEKGRRVPTVALPAGKREESLTAKDSGDNATSQK
jgi:hypothetical protein